MSGRLACLVPGCRHTTARPFREWICADHWRLVDRRMKQLRRRAERRGRLAIARWFWENIKRQAIERAAGI